MTLELVVLLLAALAFFLLSVIALRVRNRKLDQVRGPRDPALQSDVHIDARRRELARLNRPAAKGFRAHHSEHPRWRFDDQPATKKRPQ